MAPTTSAMADLRAATATAHARIEARLDVDARLATAAGYADLLGRLRGFYGPVEAWLAPAAAVLSGLDFDARRKTALLDADLAVLGAAPPAARFAPPDEPPDACTALGVLYVLEGATLGGKVVGRRARCALADPPTAFLGAYGCDVGPRWRAFGALVDAHAPDGATPAMRGGAGWCFSAMEAWLCR